MKKFLIVLGLMLLPALSWSANIPGQVPMFSRQRIGATVGVSRVWTSDGVTEQHSLLFEPPQWEANVNGAYSFDHFALVAQVAKGFDTSAYDFKAGIRFRLVQNGKLFGAF